MFQLDNNTKQPFGKTGTQALLLESPTTRLQSLLKTAVSPISQSNQQRALDVNIMAVIAQHLKLASRPQQAVSPVNFRTETVTLSALKTGEVLVKAIYLSIDPATRLYISDRKTYWRQVTTEEAIPTLGIASVVASESKRFKIGDLVRGMLACGDLVVVHESDLLKVPPGVRDLSLLLGPLGHHGLTAYVGLMTVGKAQKGETVLVSAAAGATGSLVVQIAKIMGCQVVGIVGTEEKKQWVVRMLGADACINYNEAGSLHHLSAICPNGVDLYWDNVGGAILDAALVVMNPGARAILCGAISGYDKQEEDPCFNLHLVISKHIALNGFIVRNYEKHYKEAMAALVGWVSKGQLVFRKTVLRGLEKVPEGLVTVLQGGNIGKTLVQVAEDPFKQAPKL